MILIYRNPGKSEFGPLGNPEAVLSIGKAYEVLEVSKSGFLVRVMDDRGVEVWETRRCFEAAEEIMKCVNQ